MVSEMGWRRCDRSNFTRPGSRLVRSGEDRPKRDLHGRIICIRKKRGLDIGKTKRGKGTKIMAIADRHGLPVAIGIASASPHEVTLVDSTIEARFIEEVPERIIADKAYDSDPLDKQLYENYGIELIAPHKGNRVKPPAQDGRLLRRYKRRWKVERLFAWLQNYRRLVVRYEFHSINFLEMLQLACILILLRRF